MLRLLLKGKYVLLALGICFVCISVASAKNTVNIKCIVETLDKQVKKAPISIDYTFKTIVSRQPDTFSANYLRSSNIISITNIAKYDEVLVINRKLKQINWYVKINNSYIGHVWYANIAEQVIAQEFSIDPLFFWIEDGFLIDKIKEGSLSYDKTSGMYFVTIVGNYIKDTWKIWMNPKLDFQPIKIIRISKDGYTIETTINGYARTVNDVWFPKELKTSATFLTKNSKVNAKSIITVKKVLKYKGNPEDMFNKFTFPSGCNVEDRVNKKNYIAH